MHGVSVIICCYNSAARLPETLQHLALQQVQADLPWEVIVVDNASTDNTVAVAKAEWHQQTAANATFKIIDQPLPGKNHALEKGMAEASYDYLIICDDDNWLCNNYVATAADVMQADTRLAVLGGCGIYEPEQPVNPEIGGYESSYINGSQTWASAQHWVYGAGSVYRKQVFTDLKNAGWELITSGRVGGKLNGGEDVEYCFMAYLAGYKIAADDRLQFRHFVPLKRQKLSYIVTLNYWLNYSNVLLNSYFSILHDDKRPLRKMLNQWLVGSMKTLSKTTLYLLYQRVKTGKSPSMTQRIALSAQQGTFKALLHNRK